MMHIKEKLKDSYTQNVLMNYGFRILTIVLGLVSTRITLDYLGNSTYGIWITVTSIIAWMNSGDLGIGNGLRNALAKAYGENDVDKQRKLIDAAIGALTKISLVLIVILILLCEILIHFDFLNVVARIPMYITTVFFGFNLILGAGNSVALGYQKSWLTTFNSCLIQILMISTVVIMGFMGVAPNLNVFSIVNGLCLTLPNIIVLLILRRQNIILFSRRNRRVSNDVVKTIMSSGLYFFAIQICAVILYSTDSLIIENLFSDEMVTKYSIITKVYDTGSSLFSILLISLWSAVTVHIVQRDYKWVIDKIKSILKIWVVFSLGVCVVSLLFNQIVKIWLGAKADYYEPSIVILFGAYCILAAFTALFTNVLNGMGKIKLQLAISIFEAIMNIPLSIYFGRNLGMGIAGVKFATFICVICSAVVLSIQAIYLLKKK